MALADISVFMIRATYMDNMAESRCGGETETSADVLRLRVNSLLVFLSRITDIRMDIAVPEAVGSQPALEVEQCACPQGYRGPSCQVLLQLWATLTLSCDLPSSFSLVVAGVRRRLHARQLWALPGHM